MSPPQYSSWLPLGCFSSRKGNEMPTLHSSLGASSSKRWLACPGSIRLSKDQPSSPTNRYAAEGTVAHKVGETALLEGENAKNYIGMYGDGEQDCELYEEPTGAEFEFKVTAEMARAVQVYLDAIRDTMTELELAHGEKPLMLVEKSFSLNFIQDGMFGTNDCCVWLPGVYLGVFDYKHGKGLAVEVEDNSQLNYYGLGALRELCWTEYAACAEMTDEYTKLPETVELVIVQPRAPHTNGGVRRWETTADYLVCDFAEQLKRGAVETLKPDSAINAGSHCKWCPAETICPALEAKAQEEMRVSFGEIDVSELETPTKSKKAGKAHAASQALKRTPEELGRILACIPFIEGWAASMKASAQTQLENGEIDPEELGFKLVKGTARRRWKGEDLVISSLDELLSPEEYLQPPKLKSFTEIEQIPGMDAFVRELTEKPEPALTIAPLTDRRPAVQKSAKSAGFDTDEI